MSFAYTNEINKIMFADGVMFALPGLLLMLSPNPQRQLKEKPDSKTAIGPLKDVRFALGAAYTSMGMTVAVLGGIIAEKGELNNFAKFRAISLVFIVYAIISQIQNKKWKKSGYTSMYLILYALLALVYAFLGFIDPMPTY